jgi:hypothetical protein
MSLHAAEGTSVEAGGLATLPSIDDEDERASSISSWDSASAHGSDRDDDNDDEDDRDSHYVMHDALDLEPLPGRRKGSGLSVPDHHDADAGEVTDFRRVMRGEQQYSAGDAGNELEIHTAGRSSVGHSPKRGSGSLDTSSQLEDSRARIEALEHTLLQESRRTRDLEAQLTAQAERTAALETTVARLVSTVAAMQQQQVDE